MEHRVQEEGSQVEIMTLSEVAEYLKLAEKTVLRMVHEEKIPCARVASQWRFMRTVIDDWLLSQMKQLHKDDLEAYVAQRADEPFYRLIQTDLILELKPGSKEEVLAQLIQPLVERKLIRSKAIFLEKLMERERMISTALGKGVAVPHLRHPQENPGGSSLLVIGICRPGTDFEAPDGKKTQLFFLLCSESEVVHLRVMSRLTAILRRKDVPDRILAAGRKDEVIRILDEEDPNRKSEV